MSAFVQKVNHMKSVLKCWLPAVFVAAAAALTMVSVAADTTPTPTKRLAIVAIGDVPAKLADHAREWAEQNLAIKVDLLPAEKTSGKNLDDIAAQAVKAGGANHPHVIAIALPPEGVNNHGMRTADGRAAVVNLRPMQADKPDEETLSRRIERQTIRAMALLLDVGTCPNPQCALSRYSTLQELDQAGRNCCPPCLQKFQENAAKELLEPNKTSHFYLRRK